MQLSYMEFIEAFSRIADVCAFPQFTTKRGWKPDEASMKKEDILERKNLPLWVKIESTLQIIIRQMDRNEISHLKLPKSTIFDNEYNLKEEVFDDYEDLLDRTGQNGKKKKKS